MLAAALLLAAVHGLPCTAVQLDAQGRPLRCTLESSAVIGGAAIPAGSIVLFDANGVPRNVFLERDTRIAGHVCRGEPVEWETGFHPDGTLSLCWLAADEVIDGVTCRRATMWADITGGSVGVHLWPNGHLKQCEAGAPLRSGTCAAGKGDTVRVDERGGMSVNGAPCRR